MRMTVTMPGPMEHFTYDIFPDTRQSNPVGVKKNTYRMDRTCCPDAGSARPRVLHNGNCTILTAREFSLFRRMENTEHRNSLRAGQFPLPGLRGQKRLFPVRTVTAMPAAKDTLPEWQHARSFP